MQRSGWSKRVWHNVGLFAVGFSITLYIRRTFLSNAVSLSKTEGLPQTLRISPILANGVLNVINVMTVS